MAFPSLRKWVSAVRQTFADMPCWLNIGITGVCDKNVIYVPADMMGSFRNKPPRKPPHLWITVACHLLHLLASGRSVLQTSASGNCPKLGNEEKALSISGFSSGQANLSWSVSTAWNLDYLVLSRITVKLVLGRASVNKLGGTERLVSFFTTMMLLSLCNGAHLL